MYNRQMEVRHLYRLLVVDDEPAIAEGLAEMLSSTDLPLKEVRFSLSAKNAMAEFEAEPFELVLADIRMPEMNGLELVEKVKQRWPHVQVVFLSGYTDFEYARRAIQLGAANYLLKPTKDEKVVEVLKAAIQQLEARFEQMLAVDKSIRQAKDRLSAARSDWFRRMLRMEFRVDSAEFVKAIQDLVIPISPEQPFWTLLLRIDDYGRRFRDTDSGLIQFAVQNMMGELLDGPLSLISFHYERDMLVYLIQTHKRHEVLITGERLKENLSDASETILRVLGVSVSFALPASPVHWRDLPQGFRVWEHALRLCPHHNSLLVSEQLHQANIQYGRVNELVTEVESAIQLRSLDSFEKALTRAFLNANEPISKEQASIQYLAVAQSVSNLLFLYKLSDRLDSVAADLLSNWNAHRDVHSMIAFLVDLFRKILHKMTTLRQNSSETLVEQVKQHIGARLHEDLSLNALAKSKFVSPSYLSRIFHQWTGEPLMAYITRLKMEHAKDMLRNPDLRIQDVSERLGFQSANYFSKVFRKSVGISPQDYRSSILSG